MGPSTMPSICKSSVPVTSPLIWMLAPRRAPPRAGTLLSFPGAGWLNGTTGDAGACEGETAGGSATAPCCLDHIIRTSLYRNPEIKFAPGGREQCGVHVVPRGATGQQRNEADLRSLELDEGTGEERQKAEGRKEAGQYSRPPTT